MQVGEILTWQEKDIRYIFPYFKCNFDEFKNNFTKYSKGKKHLSKYASNNFVNAPIWKLSVYWSFGETVKLFSYSHNQVKKNILDNFGQDVSKCKDFSQISAVFILMNDVRNIICHNNVLFKINYGNNIDKLKEFIKLYVNKNFNVRKIRLGNLLQIIDFILPNSKIYEEIAKCFKKFILNKNIHIDIKNEIKRYTRTEFLF